METEHASSQSELTKLADGTSSRELTAHMDRRYGKVSKAEAKKPRRRWKLVILGAATLLIAVVGVAGYSWLRGPGISTDAITYTIVSDHEVNVTFNVIKDPAKSGFCAVQTQEEDFAVSGFKIVPIPANGTDVGQNNGRVTTHTTRILTDAPGLNATVNSCWLAN